MKENVHFPFLQIEKWPNNGKTSTYNQHIISTEIQRHREKTETLYLCASVLILIFGASFCVSPNSFNHIIQLSQVEYLIDIQVFSSFCVDRKKKQERTANTLHRRTNGLSGVWLRNSRLRRSDSPRPRRHRKASFVTDGSRYRSPC